MYLTKLKKGAKIGELAKEKAAKSLEKQGRNKKMKKSLKNLKKVLDKPKSK